MYSKWKVGEKSITGGTKLSNYYHPIAPLSGDQEPPKQV